jgi:glycine/D-amino acid oxidase-like deaminating enzyme
VSADRTNDDPPWAAQVPERVDVVVIGAGVAGTSLAHGLSRGARVALVDPMQPRHSVARRSAGLVYSGMGEHPARLVASMGLERARALYGLCRRSTELLALHLTPADQLWVATLPGELPLIEESVAALQSMGWPAVRLGESGLAERRISGTDGWVVPGDGVVHPERAWLGLLQQAQARGAVLVQGRALRVHDDKDGVKVETELGTIRAEIVVFACGAPCRELDSSLVEALWPVRENAAQFPLALPPSSGRAGHGWTWFRASGVPEEGTVIGGCRWATPHLEVGETEPEVVEVVQQRLAAFAERHLGCAEAPLKRWAWIETHSCDGLPLVGPLPGTTRRLVCTGFGGNDWGLGPACAELVVEGLLGSQETPAFLSPSRLL